MNLSWSRVVCGKTRRRPAGGVNGSLQMIFAEMPHFAFRRVPNARKACHGNSAHTDARAHLTCVPSSSDAAKLKRKREDPQVGKAV